MRAQRVCRVLADVKGPAVEKALRAASTNFCPDIQLPAFGALAVLGDNDALVHLRGFACEGHALDRAQAIRWLGICRDYESVPLLRKWLDDEEPWIREAAREVLSSMGATLAQPDR